MDLQKGHPVTQGLPINAFAARKPSGQLWQRVVLWAIGGLMLLALIVKAVYGLPTGGFWAKAWGWTGVAMNLAILVAAIRCRPSVALWSGLIVLHLFLGGLSIAHLYVGNRSCGCFGATEVSPIYTVALNAAIVAALVFTFPRRSH